MSGSRNRAVRRLLLWPVTGLLGMMGWFSIPAPLDADGRGKRDLRAAVAAGDVERTEQAVVEVVRRGDVAALKSLLDLVERIPPQQDGIYWALIGGAASFGDRAPLLELGKFTTQRKTQPIARDLLYGLNGNASPYFVIAFRPLLTDGPDELRTLVAKKVATIQSHDAVDGLIELLKYEEKQKPKVGELTEIGWVAVEGLTRLTGQNYGNSSVNWEGWWKRSRDQKLARKSDEEGGRHTGTAVDFVKQDVARREAFVGVEKAPEKSVVVLSAKFTRKIKRDLNNDHMENVLVNMGIPHTVVPREDFAAFDLKDTGVLLVNCAQYHEFCSCPDCKLGVASGNRLYRCLGCAKHPANSDNHPKFSSQLSPDEIKKITDFVLGGGFLFCEDWTVKEIIEKAYPKYVVAGAKLSEGAVDVIPGRGHSLHPYLKGLFEPKLLEVPAEISDSSKLDKDGRKGGATVVVKRDASTASGPGEGEPVKVKHSWKIDNESFAIRIVDKARVVAFLASGKIQQDASGDGAVAVAFRPGPVNLPPGTRAVPRGTPGVVTVVLSHFGKQNSQADEMSIQNLLLNVLIDANIAREARAALGAGKKKAAKRGPAE